MLALLVSSALLLQASQALWAAEPPTPATAQAASQPVSVELHSRIAIGSKKGSTLDPRLSDIYGSLKDFVFTNYTLKDERTVSVDLHVQTKIPLSGKRTVVLTPLEYRMKGRPRVLVRVEIPEVKFKTEIAISVGGTLVIGGPKVEDGVVIFALGVTKITPR